MTYIKKLVMQGFKSFARKTEIPFENSMNVIVGPNGSGKSNVTDALCFVLGRINIKSIRAAKAANLLFSGNKIYKGSNEASVELVFDNSNKTFSMDSQEVSIKRIVRKNGQSLYKINNITKTRQELLELLSSAGIDPKGFNIVLQGEINSLVKATSEERRKIIEDVAGISVYESRKEKSINELEKAEEKLKEVGAVLRERNNYLKNLERERQDALNFQKLENSIKACKKTLLFNSLKEKEKELWSVDKLIENNSREIAKLKQLIKEKDIGVEELEVKISAVSQKISDVTNNEQDILHRDISDLRADLAGLSVRFENFSNRIAESREKIEEFDSKKANLEKEINEIKTSSPEIKKKQNEQKMLQEKFDSLEVKRRRYYILKSELSNLEHQKEQKENFLANSKKEIELIERSLDLIYNEIKFAKDIKSLEDLRLKTRHEIVEIKNNIENLRASILDIERRSAVISGEIKREDEIKSDILKLSSCPVCRQSVNEDYKKSINEEAEKKIFNLRDEEGKILEKKDGYKKEIEELEEKLFKLNSKVSDIEISVVKLRNAESKKEDVKLISANQKKADLELGALISKISKLLKEFDELDGVEDLYDEVRMKLQDFNFAKIDVGSEVGIKQREISRISLEKKALVRDLEESEIELRKVSVLIEEKRNMLSEKEEREKEIYVKARKLYDDKNELEDKQKVLETDIIGLQHNVRSFEERINESKITRAQIDAQASSLKDELKSFEGVEILKQSTLEVKERLQKAQFRITGLGSVNLKALEVFDQVKEQVELIQEKVNTIVSEKENILKVIEEIDRKKKKAFMVTLNSVNELFTRNYSQISRKGEVTLELEDKKEPFSGGINIVVRMSKGRFFDITSLSGGEKTMVALSLIFAIQEYKPYYFYIFDEIDAALDKHNSELLAGLIKRYMKTGQYIIITHNDTLISESSTLYGVSMQENISKVISLRV
jgi:chromosome segregation protein